LHLELTLLRFVAVVRQFCFLSFELRLQLLLLLGEALSQLQQLAAGIVLVLVRTLKSLDHQLVLLFVLLDLEVQLFYLFLKKGIFLLEQQVLFLHSVLLHAKFQL